MIDPYKDKENKSIELDNTSYIKNLIKKNAKNLASKTTGAYSYGLYYDDKAWNGIIEYFYSIGFSPAATETVIRSKYMRWIADEYRSDFYKLQPGEFSPPVNLSLENFLTVIHNSDNNSLDELLQYVLEEHGTDAVDNEIYNTMNEDMGGVSAPMATPMNTPGMGNAMLPQGGDVIGSGDNWNNGTGGKKRKVTVKKKKKKPIDEESINPHDKIGTTMAKKLKIPLNFKKKGQGAKQKKIVKESLINSKIASFEIWKKKNNITR